MTPHTLTFTIHIHIHIHIFHTNYTIYTLLYLYLFHPLIHTFSLLLTFSHFHSLQTHSPLQYSLMNTEILQEFSASNDQMIVKRKRTKRLRPSSSASSSGGDFNSSSLVSSPTTSSSTEEDEDLANCLILLARGGFSPQSERPETKFSSRKFTEMAVTANGKVGMYVYECKTCSRTFPSFQALGGHRASHKKPKPAADSDQKKPLPPPPEEEEVEEAKFTIAPPPSITQLIGHVENKPKIHECSICGAEFASGQALGGHMRRHRSVPAAARSAGDSSSHHDDHHVVEKARNMLVLDLNLPAPPEDDRREAEFRAFSSNQPRLVFSAAALVDCHY